MKVFEHNAEKLIRDVQDSRIPIDSLKPIMCEEFIGEHNREGFYLYQMMKQCEIRNTKELLLVLLEAHSTKSLRLLSSTEERIFLLYEHYLQTNGICAILDQLTEREVEIFGDNHDFIEVYKAFLDCRVSLDEFYKKCVALLRKVDDLDKINITKNCMYNSIAFEAYRDKIKEKHESINKTRTRIEYNPEIFVFECLPPDGHDAIRGMKLIIYFVVEMNCHLGPRRFRKSRSMSNSRNLTEANNGDYFTDDDLLPYDKESRRSSVDGKIKGREPRPVSRRISHYYRQKSKSNDCLLEKCSTIKEDVHHQTPNFDEGNSSRTYEFLSNDRKPKPNPIEVVTKQRKSVEDRIAGEDSDSSSYRNILREQDKIYHRGIYLDHDRLAKRHRVKEEIPKKCNRDHGRLDKFSEKKEVQIPVYHLHNSVIYTSQRMAPKQEQTGYDTVDSAGRKFSALRMSSTPKSAKNERSSQQNNARVNLEGVFKMNSKKRVTFADDNS